MRSGLSMNYAGQVRLSTKHVTARVMTTTVNETSIWASVIILSLNRQDPAALLAMIAPRITSPTVVASL